MTDLELLAPAGDLEKLKIALRFGADSVYFAGKEYGLRAFAPNFSLEEMATGVKLCHESGARAYLAVNIFPHNADLVGFREYIKEAVALGIDALILADPGLCTIVKDVCPEVRLHISTQANVTNWATVRFWQAQGATRIILARELSLAEIAEIRQRVPEIELEVFVHGAMCISYSGRCLLSNYFNARGANQGQCTHPCRWNYALVEETRPGHYFPVVEDERGTHILSSRDLRMLEHIPALAKAGVDSLKIEGRMKGVAYVAGVTNAYRQAIDAYKRAPDTWQPLDTWLAELEKVSHRPYTTGFFFGDQAAASMSYSGPAYVEPYKFVGLVRSYHPETKIATVEVRNRIRTGDQVEFLVPGGTVFAQTIEVLIDEKGEQAEVVHANTQVTIKTDQPVTCDTVVRLRM